MLWGVKRAVVWVLWLLVGVVAAGGQSVIAVPAPGQGGQAGSVVVGPGLGFLPPGSNSGRWLLDTGRLVAATLPAGTGIQRLPVKPVPHSAALVIWAGSVFSVSELDANGEIEFVLPASFVVPDFWAAPAIETVLIFYLGVPGGSP